MQVLEHDDQGSAQGTRQGREQVCRGRIVLGHRLELPACLRGNVEEGPERSRREQRLAGAGQHGHPCVARTERAYQRCLTYARLTRQEHQAPTARSAYSSEPFVKDV